jgi:hypothetical protein
LMTLIVQTRYTGSRARAEPARIGAANTTLEKMPDVWPRLSQKR